MTAPSRRRVLAEGTARPNCFDTRARARTDSRLPRMPLDDAGHGRQLAGASASVFASISDTLIFVNNLMHPGLEPQPQPQPQLNARARKSVPHCAGEPHRRHTHAAGGR